MIDVFRDGECKLRTYERCRKCVQPGHTHTQNACASERKSRMKRNFVLLQCINRQYPYVTRRTALLNKQLRYSDRTDDYGDRRIERRGDHLTLRRLYRRCPASHYSLSTRSLAPSCCPLSIARVAAAAAAVSCRLDFGHQLLLRSPTPCIARAQDSSIGRDPPADFGYRQTGTAPAMTATAIDIHTDMGTTPLGTSARGRRARAAGCGGGQLCGFLTKVNCGDHAIRSMNGGFTANLDRSRN